MTIDGSSLKAKLQELGVNQADLARLLGITPRAITLWITGERAISGPAEAYLRLFELLPSSLRQIELNRLKERGTNMRDGMYGITYQSKQDEGMGMLIFDNGRVYGTDIGGVRYDGDYIFNEDTGLVAARTKVTFPPNVMSVFGVSNPYEWAIDITATFNPKQDSGPLAVKTSIGQAITAQYVYLRALPEAIAA